MLIADPYTAQELQDLFPEYGLAQLRVGRIGVMYEAVTLEGERFLLRLLLREQSSDPSGLLHWNNELMALSQLNGEHFLELLEHGERGGVFFARYTFIEGATINEAYQAKLPFKDACYIVAHVASALAEMHERGMTHLGVKRSNVQINPQGQVKLLQLGQVRFSDSRHAHIEYPPLLGTQGYSAPELIDGSCISSGADIYACGALLSELLTGMTPEKYNETLSESVNAPKSIDHLIELTTQADLHQRLKNASDLSDLLHMIMAGEIISDELLVSITLGIFDSNMHEESIEEIKTTASFKVEEKKPLKRKHVRMRLISFAAILCICWGSYHLYQIHKNAEQEIVPDAPVVLKGWVSYPNHEHLSENLKAREEYAKKHLIKEKIAGVRFFLLKPKGEIKGMLVDIPWDFDPTSMTHQFARFDYIQSAFNRGYAIFGWESPARKWTEGDDYGVDEYMLTSIQLKNRRERWKDWLPKIDNGISKMCKKHGLPENGFIARVDCLSAARLSRYLERYADRFSAVVFDKPHGLFEPTKVDNHVFCVLTTPINHSYYKSASQFFIRAKRAGYPVSSQILVEGSNIKYNHVTNMMFEYIYRTMEAEGGKGTLSFKQRKSIANRFRKDLSESEYIQDSVNQGLYKRTDAKWIPSIQFSEIPEKQMAAFWQKGWESEDTRVCETFDSAPLGKLRSYNGTCVNLTAVTGEFNILNASRNGRCVQIPANKLQIIEVDFKLSKQRRDLRFKFERFGGKSHNLSVEIYKDEHWVNVFNGDDIQPRSELGVYVTIPIPAGVNKMRISGKAITGKGLLFDEFLFIDRK